MTSARALGSMPAATHSVSPPRLRRLDRSIFLRCPKAAAVTFSSAANSASEGRSGLGFRRTTAEATFGGGVKALAGRSMTTAALQTAGRGRRGRAWSTQRGNLAATLLTLTDRPPAEAAQLSFVAALAACDLADTCLGPGVARLKWPNDVLVHGRKAVAGRSTSCGACARFTPMPTT